MFRKTQVFSGVLVALGGALLAQSAAAQAVQRIEITGSAIKQIDGETSVPVTIIKMDDLKNAGVTSVEQVMQNLSSVQIQQNATQSVGSNSGGATLADLRGIGADKTLVLLNGERIANNAVNGSAPDLNMIPFAAIERIEVLRDGASSLYGTDAIGGVINFITKKNYSGGTATIGYDSPQHKGGKVVSANLGFGYGDLDSQRFNVFGFVSARKQDAISGNQRNFGRRIPGGLSNSTDPANYIQDGAFYNPAAPDCVGTELIPVKGGTQCKIVTPGFVDYSPKAKTVSGMLKGTFRVSNALDLGLEAFATQNKVTTAVAPVPYGGYYLNPTMPNGQPNPYFPTSHINPTFDDGSAGAPAFNPSSAFANPANVQPGFAYVFWRDFPNGLRAQENTNNQSRLMATADGSVANWDYSVKLSYNRNKVDQRLVGGYGNGDIIGEGLLEGVINPFGAQSEAGSALLQSAALNGLLSTATGTVKIAKATASREIGDWFSAGRPAQVAVGLEYRKEDFVSKANTPFAELVSASTGVDPNSLDKGNRNVTAVFTEVVVPVVKSLDVTGSVRYDKYSDFGSTTNPKLSFRFQPLKQVLFRGSASTGFRAPTLYELHSSPAYTNTGGNYDNPINCPNGTPLPGLSNGANCDAQFQVLNGGNLNLKPEKSKNYTLGAVFEPVGGLSVGLDFWWIRVTQTIASLAQETVFGDYQQFQQYFHFGPGNVLSIASNCPGPNCGYVDQNQQNLGGTNTNGVDLSLRYSMRTGVGMFDTSLSSTYVSKYEYQDYQSGPFNQNVGVYSGAGPVFRWQHNLGVQWSWDAFGAGAALHYKSGYLDFDPSNTVASYTTMDLYGTWSPVKPLALTLGVRNLSDKAPPFSNQTSQFQSGGWDSRFSDPVGRTYYVRGTYSF